MEVICQLPNAAIYSISFVALFAVFCGAYGIGYQHGQNRDFMKRIQKAQERYQTRMDKIFAEHKSREESTT